MAKMKGSSSMVKDMGDKLIKDHTHNSDDLKSLASSRNLTLPAEPNAKQKAQAEELNKLEGASFDQAFSSALLKGHRKAIAMFETAAKSSDVEVKAYAEKSLPVLKEHEKMATSGMGDSTKARGSKKKVE